VEGGSGGRAPLRNGAAGMAEPEEFKGRRANKAAAVAVGWRRSPEWSLGTVAVKGEGKSWGELGEDGDGADKDG
jgi:hypothetical protein